MGVIFQALEKIPNENSSIYIIYLLYTYLYIIFTPLNGFDLCHFDPACSINQSIWLIQVKFFISRKFSKLFHL